METTPISETIYKNILGYKLLWHKRLSHCQSQSIKDKIQHSKGLHELEEFGMNKHEMYINSMPDWESKIASISEIKESCETIS
jgi:hypothetical protein